MQIIVMDKNGDIKDILLADDMFKTDGCFKMRYQQAFLMAMSYGWDVVFTKDSMSGKVTVERDKPPTQCECSQKKEIVGFQYITVEKHIGFVDHDHWDFIPKFCPFCGSKK